MEFVKIMKEQFHDYVTKECDFHLDSLLSLLTSSVPQFCEASHYLGKTVLERPITEDSFGIWQYYRVKFNI